MTYCISGFVSEILESSKAKCKNQSAESALILNRNGSSTRYSTSNLPKEFLSLTELNAVEEPIA